MILTKIVSVKSSKNYFIRDNRCYLKISLFLMTFNGSNAEKPHIRAMEKNQFHHFKHETLLITRTIINLSNSTLT